MIVQARSQKEEKKKERYLLFKTLERKEILSSMNKLLSEKIWHENQRIKLKDFLSNLELCSTVPILENATTLQPFRFFFSLRCTPAQRLVDHAKVASANISSLSDLDTDACDSPSRSNQRPIVGCWHHFTRGGDGRCCRDMVGKGKGKGGKKDEDLIYRTPGAMLTSKEKVRTKKLEKKRTTKAWEPPKGLQLKDKRHQER